MSLRIFEPHQIAEKCYLHEALLWVAVNRFPLAYYDDDDNGAECREAVHKLWDFDPAIPGDFCLSDSECSVAGLPVCPKYQDVVSGDYHLGIESAKNLLEIRKVQEQSPDDEVWQRDIEELEEQVAETEKFWAQQAEWRNQFEAFVDVHKAQLFLELRKGRLKAIGRRLPQPTFKTSISQLEEEHWHGWDEVSWTPIPSESWISTGVNWEDCWVEGRDDSHVLILIDTASLLELFPHKDVALTGVMRIGGVLAIREDGMTPATRKPARGRKPNPWEELYVEIARRLRDGELPAKQESFINDMQDWCRRN